MNVYDDLDVVLRNYFFLHWNDLWEELQKLFTTRLFETQFE